MIISKKEFVKVKKWIERKQSINNSILLSIASKNKTHSIYWLLIQQIAVDEAREIWWEMNYQAKRIAEDIAV